MGTRIHGYPQKIPTMGRVWVIFLDLWVTETRDFKTHCWMGLGSGNKVPRPTGT
ncbi:unnamed protein product [Lupinus luteus]|uniref:Uncharacterized protein n=1 Tax=Lupinus luteus TaxID=3873 RepID=A0AAV1Y9A7_LUPLU